MDDTAFRLTQPQRIVNVSLKGAAVSRLRLGFRGSPCTRRPRGVAYLGFLFGEIMKTEGSPMNEETGPEPEIQRVEGFPLPEPEQTTVGTEPLRPAEMIRLPAKKNPVLQQLLANINADEDLHTLWRCQNINAVDRLGMSDHGPIHMQIVVNISLTVSYTHLT